MMKLVPNKYIWNCRLAYQKFGRHTCTYSQMRWMKNALKKTDRKNEQIKWISRKIFKSLIYFVFILHCFDTNIVWESQRRKCQKELLSIYLNHHQCPRWPWCAPVAIIAPGATPCVEIDAPSGPATTTEPSPPWRAACPAWPPTIMAPGPCAWTAWPRSHAAAIDKINYLTWIKK